MLNTYNPVFNRAYDDIIRKLDLCGIIPLIKIEDVKNALPLAGALLGADLTVAEITFRSACASDVIRLLTSRFPDLIVGAGTVINLKQVQEAYNAGAKYVVTPAFNPAVVDRCIELGIPVFPGCSTASDIDQAYSRGLRVVKFFPSELLGGVEMMKALSGPYPFMKFIPTGGINLSNLSSYLSFGKVLCCAGTFIASEENLAEGLFAEITRTAHAAVDEVLGLKLDHVALNLDPGDAEDALKGFARFAGKNYNPAETTVFGVEAVKNSDRNAVGHVVYSSPNLERCVYYLRNRGFCVDETCSVKEKGRLSEIFLLAKFGGFEIKIIKR
ncbi:MAG: bifunctional 4-hydroxy-2-oxoglutarate aldolase/2-dehydro-3-deoxy-phosphogluconate aldolase [Christensenellales bacterium]